MQNEWVVVDVIRLFGVVLYDHFIVRPEECFDKAHLVPVGAAFSIGISHCNRNVLPSQPIRGHDLQLDRPGPGRNEDAIISIGLVRPKRAGFNSEFFDVWIIGFHDSLDRLMMPLLGLDRLWRL